MPCFSIIFALCGIWMIFRGWRGASIPAGPRCARCGYDLQGFVGTEVQRCSECGGDLSDPQAISRAKFKTRRKLMAAGVVVIALPWMFLLLGMLNDYIGPHWERFRSNQSIIAAIQSEPMPMWAWFELKSRVVSGRLSKPEASAAVDSLTRYFGQTSDPFNDGNDFLNTADSVGAVSGRQVLRIAQSCLLNYPKIHFNESFVPSNQPTQLHVDLGFQAMPFWNCSLQFVAREVLLRPDLNRPVNVPENVASSQPTTFHIPFTGMIMAATNAPPGKYRATCIIDMAIVPNWSIGSALPPPGQPMIWTGARAQWIASDTVPLEILPPYVYSNK